MILTPLAPEAVPVVEEAAPAPPCLLVNPRSFRAARGLADRAIALAHSRGAEVAAVEEAADVAAAVARIVARRQRHVAVLAGDGTVRELVEQLARQPGGRFVPDLLVLPGGRTNLTAADLVPRRDALGTLTRAFDSIAAGRWDAAVEERALLCVAHDPAAPRFGFFFGGAAVDHIVRLAQDHRYGGSGALRSGHLSSPWVLTKLAARALVGRADIPSPPLQIEADGLGRLGGEIRLVLATTLQHRRGAFDPYAARGEGALRLTAATRGARRFWPSLPRLLTGRYSMAMNPENGYLSGRCERARIVGLSGYVLDGERFETDPARPVVLSAGPRLRFVTA